MRDMRETNPASAGSLGAYDTTNVRVWPATRLDGTSCNACEADDNGMVPARRVLALRVGTSHTGGTVIRLCTEHARLLAEQIKAQL